MMSNPIDILTEVRAERDEMHAALIEIGKHVGAEVADDAPVDLVAREVETYVAIHRSVLRRARAAALRRNVLIAERDAARGAIEQVRAFHDPVDGEWCCKDPHCETCTSGGAHVGQVCALCTHDDWEDTGVAIWPCPTVRILDTATPAAGGEQ